MLNAVNNFKTRTFDRLRPDVNYLFLDDVDGLPNTPFLLTINNNRENMEIVKVTKVYPDYKYVDIERGQEGTEAVEHAVGSIVENNFTAGTYHSLLDELEKKESEIVKLESSLDEHINDTATNLEEKMDKKQPEIISIEDGFARGVSGRIRLLKTQDQLAGFYIYDLISDEPFDGDVITLPIGYRPMFRMSFNINIYSDSGGLITGSLYRVHIHRDGTVSITPSIQRTSGATRVLYTEWAFYPIREGG